MAINVKIDGGFEPVIQDNSVTVRVDSAPSVGVKIVDPYLHEIKFKLNMRRAMNGDLMIFDHPDIDIVYMIEKKKIVTFAKDLMSDMTYGTSSRLLERLSKKGLLVYESIQGGNVYGSLEGKLQEAVDNAAKDKYVGLVLNQISEWIETERPYFKAAQQYDDLLDTNFADPPDDETTRLGKVPQEVEKGSMMQSSLFGPYYYGRYVYE
tara:strand:+ start:7693 stop:8316 length:624 start_codon:yes stop_codon:yes gene_type:complete